MLAFVVAVCCVAPDLETGTMIGKAESGAITYEYRLKIPCIICVTCDKRNGAPLGASHWLCTIMKTGHVIF